jgi:hypothetical protein
MWVRQTSVDPIGVPQLANSIEHAERAAAALRVAQDAIAGYLAALGLAHDAARPPGGDWRAALAPDETTPAEDSPHQPNPERLGSWWRDRVTQLTGEDPPADDGATSATPSAGNGSGGAAVARNGSGSTADLLRRVAAGVRSGDRARLGRELHAVDPSVGLGLSAVTPPVLHQLAGDLLGHEPRPDDLTRLRDATAGRVRSLLPGTPPAVLDALLARVCRAPAEAGAPTNPADSAVTGSVLTGVLLARLGRDAGALDPSAPEPLRRRQSDDASDA